MAGLPLFDEDFILLMPRNHPLAGRHVCREAGRTEGATVTAGSG